MASKFARVLVAKRSETCPACKGPIFAGKSKVVLIFQTKQWVHAGNCVKLAKAMYS